MPPSPNTFACEPASATTVVALMADGIDWHARTLTKAFAAQGVTRIVVAATATDPAEQREELSAFAQRFGLLDPLT